jgi:DNA repair exonuclease SbcCD ATPase subunit
MIYEIVRDVAIMYGIYRARAILVAAVNGTLITQGVISGMFQLGRAVGFVASAWRILSAAVAANPIGAIATVLATAAVSFGLLNDNVEQAAEYQEKFGKAGAKTVSDLEMYFDTLANISNESSNYKKVMGELNSILGEYDMELVKETDTQEQLNDKRRISIQLIKEEILERKHLNEVEQGRSEYEAKVEDVRKKLREDLSDAITENFLGIGTINEEIAENAPAIANIISDVIENNISAIAGKTGDEYQKGVEKIFAEINSRMKAIGISESTLNKGWLKNSMFRMFEDDIISDAINNIARAKEELDSYTEAIDNAYEAEKKAAEDGANFNDRVEQTQRRLMDAASDTDNFAKKIESLLKQYGGENIIDFLVKVKTEVPAWMNQKGLTELTQLSARFTALATNAKKAGKTSLNVNGTEFSIEQLFQRAAQYTQAAQNKAADIEARKSSTITKEASNALKEYKSALEAVAVAKNRVKQGTADNTLVTEKEAEAQKKYNIALQKGVSLDELKKAKEGKSRGGAKKDPLGDALTKEIQLISEMQKLYKDYQKAGVDADKARIASSTEYQKSLKRQNDILKDFGIKGLTSEQLVGMDSRQLRDYYISLRDIASLKGNTKGVEALEKAISNLNVEITKTDYKKITDGLNSELGKIKDDYELAVELDANPELGGMFADMFDIDLDTLPRTAKEYADRYTKSLNKYFKEMGANIELPNMLNLTRDDMEAFTEQLDAGTLQQSYYDLIQKGYEATQAARKKEATDAIKEYDKLLQKYAEYQYKLTQIAKEANEERKALVVKFGTDEQKESARKIYAQLELEDDPQKAEELKKQLKALVDKVVGDDQVRIQLKVAIDKKEAQESAKASFEEFQKSPEWIVATGDLSGMTNRAIGGLIDSIEKYKKTAKNLDPKQIKQINNALKNLYKQQRSGNPFAAIANAMDEAKSRYDEYEEKIKGIEKELDNLYNSQDASNLEETGKKIAELTKNLIQYKKEQKDLGEVDTKTLIDAFQGVLSYVNQCISAVGELTSSLGDTQLSKQLNEVAGVFEKFGKGAQMGSAFGAYGAVIGAVAGAAIGLAGVINGNEDITNNIHVHEVAIERLNVAYKKLESSINDAYGAELFAAKETEISYKKQLLYQKERQLELEKSRSSKNQDSQEIARLSGEIEDLKNEIDELAKSISTELLGISSVGDAAENMVTSMIDAFKKGEDYMAKYSESFGDMVDNMIMKTIVSRVIGDRLSNLLEQVDAAANERAKKEKEDYERVLQQYQTFERYAVADALFYKSFDPYSEFDYFSDAYQNAQEISKEEWEGLWKKRLEYYKKLYTDAATPTPSDVESVKNDAQEWRNDVEKEFKEWMNVFGVEYGEEAESSKNELSALQQGIQSVSEPTANAIEAYLNGMSQQAYLRNDLLTQIRDTIMSFDIDVQLGVFSQMLLQLQNNYIVMQSMQSMMEGWTTPSGQGIRVELIS